eukprot:c21035_g1_i1.p1 GENE.c21035_g1_i1~~c21035_g1_i1.p1  ORF type:complete len:310 (+),score=76.86 c21035_g1_i1:66-995(+)
MRACGFQRGQLRTMSTFGEWISGLVKETASSINLVRVLKNASEKHCEFLASVPPQLTQHGPELNSAVDQYLSTVSSIAIGNSFTKRELSIGALWVWHCHILHPHSYRKDSIDSLGIVLNWGEGMSPYAPVKPKVLAQAGGAVGEVKMVPSINLQEAAIRQGNFIAKVEQFEINKATAAAKRRMVKHYVMFLELMQNSNDILVPTIPIDLIWHTHMNLAREYHSDTTRIAGRFVNHNDEIPEHMLQRSFAITAERWKDKYKRQYNKEGEYPKGDVRDGRVVAACGGCGSVGGCGGCGNAGCGSGCSGCGD